MIPRVDSVARTPAAWSDAVRRAAAPVLAVSVTALAVFLFAAGKRGTALLVLISGIIVPLGMLRHAEARR